MASDSKFLGLAVSCGGLLSWPSAVAIGGHLGMSRATVQRVLQRLVEAKSLHRTKISGEREHAWMTTSATAAAFGRQPATRFLGKGNQAAAATWTPGPTYRHDQLALIATFGNVSSVMAGDEATAAAEAEIEQQFQSTAGVHIPDGAFVLGPSLVGVEVELSKKSGTTNGKNLTSWARSLGPSILDRQGDAGTHLLAFGGQAINATLLVSPRRLARPIGAAVRRVAAERGIEPGWIFWAEPAPQKLALGQMKIWRLEHEGPPAGEP